MVSENIMPLLTTHYAIHEFVDQALNAFDNKLLILSVFLDSLKAFDTI